MGSGRKSMELGLESLDKTHVSCESLDKTHRRHVSCESWFKNSCKGGIGNLLSSLGYGRFRHGVAESNSVVRPGIKLIWTVYAIC
jgi:hypothetical protein